MAARRLRSRSRVMAEDIKSAMMTNAARVKETAVRTGGLIKSKSSGNIMRAMRVGRRESDKGEERRGAWVLVQGMCAFSARNVCFCVEIMYTSVCEM